MERQLFLWILFTASMFGLVESKLCQDGMRYHAHTHTCMIVIKKLKFYDEAEHYCKTTYTGGHLVYIFDKETDTFVRELLDYKLVAFIGLHFKTGKYRWGDRNSKVSYFGWRTKALNSKKDYSAITGTGWIEVSYSSYFVCQQTCVKRYVILVGNTDLEEKPFTIRSNQKIILSCRIYYSEGHSIQLTYRNTTSTEYLLTRTDGERLDFEINTKCTSSGQYECAFSSNVKRLIGIIKVLCPATFCDESGYIPTFPVSSRLQAITIQLCVWAFPKPKTLWLEKGIGDYLNSRDYRAEFKYANVLTTQGEIELTIFHSYPFRIGKFNLVVNNSAWSYLAFEIKGPPECPSRFKAEALDHSSVQLTWIPGNDGGTQQMFIVMMTKMSGDFVMARVEDGHVTQMMHILSNLSEATKYTFYINVNNTQGLTRCRHINSNVVTKERGIFLLNEKKFLNTTHVLKKDSNMSIKCQVSDGPVDSLELLHDKGDKQLETLIRKDNASILSYTSQVQCNSSGRYVCQVNNRSEVITKQGYIRSECDAVYCNENTQNQTLSFELLYRNETCTVTLCLWIYPQPSYFHLYKANEEIATSNYDITFNYLTSYTTKGHLTLTLFQRYNFTPGPYHIATYNSNKRSSNIEFDLTVRIAKKVESHNNTNLVRYIIIVVSVNVIIISVIVAVIVIKLKRNSSKQDVSMTTDNIYNNISESEEISVNQRPGHFERWSLRSTVIADEEPKASTQISDSANSAELTPRTDAKDEASDSRMTGEAEQTYANVTFITKDQRREQVHIKDPDQGSRMNGQENGRTSSAGINERTMTSQSDRQRTSYDDAGRTLGPEGDGRTLGPERDGRTLGPEGDGRTLGPERDGRTLGPEGDGRIRSLETEGRKLSPENVRISMIRKHNKRASGRESKSLRTSVKVNKYKDDPESCLLKNNSGKERLTFDSKHEEQTVDSKDKGHTFATENEEHSVDSDYKGHTLASENDGQTVESEYKGHKFALETDERPLDSEYKGHTFASEDEKQTVDPEDEGQTVKSRDKGHTVESKDNNRTVNLKDEGLTVISDSTNDGRTISPEGLVYVSVVIHPDTKKPEVAVTRHSKTPYESVEYASINYLATLEAKVDNENE
ncbi:lectin BRA-3 [Biomphalaria glabrata]|nr:lectin BRA-3 [Biomphalaria glabrata]